MSSTPAATLSPERDLTESMRDAMRRIASTVHIITAMDADGPLGMAATAVSSLSFDPPSLILCVNRNATMSASLKSGASFAVNVLHQQQVALVAPFSTSSLRHQRFADSGWNMDGPAPALDNAQAVLSCVVDECRPYGSHIIIVGLVKSVVVRDDVDPLLYLDGAFRGVFAPETPGDRPET
ncbi:MAG: flavin reductase [Sphingopyxis macrogoltabida]|uniref:Flavin reductase n=1 Tax=Sphingopyxis macrogoltabida TaxID=33050 RepID=A0A2W5KX56_SPHMC|nr:MAG: flavin reductase [Sphingopyxis macrogoltabida]